MSNTIGYSLGCVTPVRYNLTQGEDTTGNAVAFSLPACVPAIGTESVALDTISRSSMPTLIGFSEFVSPSTPAKKYRVLTGDGRRDRCFYFTSCTEGFSGSDAAVYYGSSRYDRVTGAFSPGAQYDFFQGPVCPASDFLYSAALNGDPMSSEGDYTTTSSNTPTVGLSFGHGCAYGTEVGLTRWCYSSGTVSKTLSDEDTEADAVARAVVTVGTGAVASRTARTTGFSFVLVTVEATLHCSNLNPEFRYRVRYDIKETNSTTLASTLVPYEVDVPEFSTSYDLDAVMLSPSPGFSLELVNYTLSTR